MNAWKAERTHFSGYGHIWTVLSVFGIQVTKRSRPHSTLCKCLACPLVCLVIASVMYILPMLFRTLMFEDLPLRVVIPCILTCFLSYAMWYLLFKRRFKLRAHFEGLEDLSSRIASEDNDRSKRKKELEQSREYFEKNPHQFSYEDMNRLDQDSGGIVLDTSEKYEFNASDHLSHRVVPNNRDKRTQKVPREEFTGSRESISCIHDKFLQRSEKWVIPLVRSRRHSANQNKNFAPDKSPVLNVFLIIFVCSQIAYPFLSVYISCLYESNSSSLWTFGLFPDFEYPGVIVVVFGNFAYMLHVVSFPGLSCLAMCAVYVRLTDILTAYRLRLQAIPSDQENRLFECVRDYSHVAHWVTRTGDLLSTPAAVLVTIDLLLMFNSVATFLLIDMSNFPQFLTENSFVLFFSTASILSLSFTASNVHIETTTLASCFEVLHEKALVRSSLPPRFMCLIKAMAEKDIQPMSAGGTVFFTRSYILSIFGGFFTYALLFINIKVSSSDE